VRPGEQIGHRQQREGLKIYSAFQFCHCKVLFFYFFEKYVCVFHKYSFLICPGRVITQAKQFMCQRGFRAAAFREIQALKTVPKYFHLKIYIFE